MEKLRVFWRDVKIVAKTVWINILLFVALLVVTGVLLRLSGIYPQASGLELLVDAFHMAVIERVVQPGEGALPLVLTFVVPLLTLFILGEGVLRVTSAFVARGEHREEWDRMVAKSFTNHIVICGVGELGRALVHCLLEAQPAARMVLVDPKPGIMAELGIDNPNVCHIMSDMTNTETLETANCRKASLVILCSGSDTLNLEAAFKVNQLNPKTETWVRLYRADLADLLEIAKKANIHFFCPYREAARVIAAHIQGKH